VNGLGLRAKGLEFMIEGLGFMFMVYGLGFMV
jgi:hypothetical protein